MSNRSLIVKSGTVPCNTEQDDWRTEAATSTTIRTKVQEHVDKIFTFLDGHQRPRPFDAVQRNVIPFVFAIGRLFLAYYLAICEERSSAKEIDGFQRRRPQPRLFGTFFGKVRYWRTYHRRNDGGDGVYPIDIQLGLLADGFSLLVMGWPPGSSPWSRTTRWPASS